MTKPRRTLESRGKSTNYVTTGGAGYIPNNYGREVKDVFYNTVGPYNTYDFNRLFRNFGKRKDDDLRKALIEDANWHIRTISKDKGYEPEHAKRLISQYSRDINNANIADELLAQYLEIPTERRHTNVRLKKSKYRDNAYSIPIDSKQWEGIIEDTNDLNIGENKSSDILSMTGLATHAIGRGYDSKGEYRSIGDSYDLNPFRGNSAVVDIPLINKINDLSFGLGKPVEVYNRMYLDDYYGVKEPTHATYLPEVVVIDNRKKHKDGGSIHIKPSKRGTFTAAATKHGMGVQEFAARVLRNKEDYSPSLVKKANFARNASKWH